jgi:hypothetical protein
MMCPFKCRCNKFLISNSTRLLLMSCSLREYTAWKLTIMFFTNSVGTWLQNSVKLNSHVVNIVAAAATDRVESFNFH